MPGRTEHDGVMHILDNTTLRNKNDVNFAIEPRFEPLGVGQRMENEKWHA
jgi:hypothetical protein